MSARWFLQQKYIDGLVLQQNDRERQCQTLSNLWEGLNTFCSSETIDDQ